MRFFGHPRENLQQLKLKNEAGHDEGIIKATTTLKSRWTDETKVDDNESRVKEMSTCPLAAGLVLDCCILHAGSLRSIASNETANNRINSTDSGSNSSNINGSTAATDLTGNGLLPLCRNCFGHGVNPSLDPRCRLGCRGGGQPTGAAPLPTRMAFAANRAPRKDGCHEIDGCSKPPYSSVIIDNSAGLPRKEQKETYIMKVHALWFCFGVLCLLTLVGLVMMIIRKVGCKKRQARVDVHNKTCTVEINAVDSA
eukprot:gene5715-6415_t